MNCREPVPAEFRQRIEHRNGKHDESSVVRWLHRFRKTGLGWSIQFLLTNTRVDEAIVFRLPTLRTIKEYDFDSSFVSFIVDDLSQAIWKWVAFERDLDRSTADLATLFVQHHEPDV